MSPELELLLACVRPDAPAPPQLPAALDWGKLLAAAKRHGVASLVSNAIEQVAPPEVSAELQARSQQVAKRNLFFTGALLRILAELSRHDIAAVPYKGPAVAEELYSDPSLREFCDLDLLVRRQDVPRAIAILRDHGYREAFELTPAQMRAHLRSGCEVALDNGQVPVEIHWDIAPRPFSLSLGDAFWRRLGKLKLAGSEVPSLGLEDLFIVLAVHGGTHLWSRLIWVSDVARLAHFPLDWCFVEEEARRLGAWRLVQLASQVAHDLLAAPATLEVDAEARALAAIVRGKLDEPDPEADAAARHRFLLRARERWPDRLRYLWRHAFTPGVADWQVTRAAGPFYPMVRIARLVRKFGRV